MRLHKAGEFDEAIAEAERLKKAWGWVGIATTGDTEELRQEALDRLRDLLGPGELVPPVAPLQWLRRID